MSQQIQISGGAKVRDLQDVIIGTSGVLSSLAFDVANGVPKLDSNGKILVSQLPNSVMEYKGTWDASTNTPTLANGTGNQGDVYLCNVAGTVNFGAGPIAFIVGDSAVYSGSIWQRSGGSTGSVTSVGLSTNGGAITIGSSPVTTSGTISFNFNGTNLQYVNGAGNLTTFPTLITSIGLSMPSAFSVANSPLTANGTIAVTGAGTTAQYIRGDGSLATFPTIATEAQRLITEVYNETGATLTKGTVVYINGGHGNLPTITKAIATGDATSAQTYGIVQTDITNNNNGYVVVIGSLTNLDTQAYANGTQLYLSSTTAGAWTSVKQYAPAHLVYVGIVTRSHPTQGVVEVRIQNGFEMDELHNVSAQSPLNNQGLFYNTSTSLWENKSIATALGYTPANDASVVHNTGNETIGGTKTFSDATKNNGGIFLQNASSSSLSGYMNLGGLTNGVKFTSGGGISNTFTLPSATGYTFTFPNATGTIALTSDLTGGTVTSVAALTIGTTGTDLSSSVANSTTTPVITLNVPTASATNRGVLSSSDWSYFNGKQGTIFTTAPLSIISNTISITQASASVDGYLSSSDWSSFNGRVSSTGSTGYIAKFSSSSAITSSGLYDDGTTVSLISRALSGSSASFSSTVTAVGYSKFWNGTTGLLIGAFSAGAGYGALYSTGVTPSTTNFALATNGASTVINATNDASIVTNNGNGLVVVGTGNVIINNGTTDSGYKLDVNGTFRATSDVVLGGGSTIFGTTGSKFYVYPAFSTNLNLLQNYNGSAYTTEEHRASDYSFKIGTTAALTIASTGNVGIGTSSPTAIGNYNALTISGTNGSFIDLRYNNTDSGRIFTNIATSLGFECLGTNPIKFSTNSGSGASEAMRITAIKNVLIGTTDDTSNTKLVLYSTTAATQIKAAGTAPAITFSNTITSPTIGGVLGAATGANQFVTGTASGDMVLANQFNTGALIFGTSNSEKARFTNGGDFCIGTTSSSGYQLRMTGYAYIGGNIVVAGGATIGGLAGTGSRAVIADASGVLSAPVSDISVKQNVKPIGYGLNDLLKMNPVWFDFIDGYKNYGEGRQNGNIAQEMQAIIPEAVFTTPSTGKMGINYDQLHAVYIKAIQELKQEIEELKLKIK